MKFVQLLDEKVQRHGNTCEANFGKKLFGELSHYWNEKEINTPYEQWAYDVVNAWIHGNKKSREKGDVITLLLPILDDLMKCKKKYSKILKPSTTKLYRGFEVKLNTIKNKHDAKVVEINGVPYYKFPFDYTPRKKIESWTSEISSARRFGNMVIEADIPQHEVIFSEEFFDSISMLWSSEHEVLRVNKNMKKIKGWGLIRNWDK